MLSFSANTRESWARFAEKIGAEHICRGNTDWNNNNDSVIYNYKGTLIILDFESTMDSDGGSSQTRIYAPLSAKENFRFNIYSSNFVERFINFLGGHDVNIGDELFDKKFSVKTNDVEKVRLLLSNLKIRELIWKVVPNGLFSPTFQANCKKGETDYISVNEPGVINDVERLELIFQLIIESFEQLVSLEIVTSKRRR
jgi:hypothetical protein